jgi:succinate-semialdehyde dehydrogenase / glutarate-semialdehyde dehydrogenase
VKPSEDTPAAVSVLADALNEAGLPAGTVNFVYGDPAEISAYLITHPTIRKVSFTGSVPVGKKLAAIAGEHMKPATMELGGHAPAMVFDDADVDQAAILLTGSKFRNAGQVCVSPTRFLVEEKVAERFTETFLKEAAKVRVGPGIASDTTMGPLVNQRRIDAMESLIADATDKGARVLLGGKRIGNSGTFFEPTVLGGVNTDMRVMNEEPFGPMALIVPFAEREDAVREANRLPYGLASYAFTRSADTIAMLESRVEAGMLSINHLGLALPETPFGGVKDSGYGSEGGTEAIEPYLVPKFVSKRLS